jgi:hypothetical protein
MTAFSLSSGNARRERVSFVPTTFFAEFLAGAHGLASESHQGPHGHAKHRLVRGDIAPSLPSKGR